MSNLLRANFFRLRKTLVFWGGLAAIAVFGGFMVWTQISDLRDLGIEFTLEEVFFGYAMVIGLFSAVLVSLFLGTDYSDGTVRNKLSVGRLRRDIYLSNLLTVTGACFLYCAAFMAVTTAMTFPIEGFFRQDPKLILTALLGSLLMCAAWCAIFTCITMSCNNKTAAALICVLLFFALLMASTYVSAMLAAPEERPIISLVDGEFVSSMEPNPRYLQSDQRAVYEFFYDLLPTGQASQYFTLGFSRPVRMMLCAVVTTAAATLGGLALFQRKDLK